MFKLSFVYILTSKNNSVLYIGVTNNLKRRIWEHKEKSVKGFSQKYNLDKLVYYEIFEDIKEAIRREKYLKKKRRDYKLFLINKENSKFKDLWDELGEILHNHIA
jgi:putative endonuclease